LLASVLVGLNCFKVILLAGRVCAFEQEFGFRIKKDNVVSEGIEIALKTEKRDQEAYAGMAAKAKNPRLKELFARLASDETLHVRELEELRECLKASGRWTEVKAKRLALPESPAVNAAKAFEATDDEVEALVAAMKGENAAEQFYRKMAVHAPKNGRKFFEKLAEMEARHYEVLDALFQEFEDAAVKLAR
jgi:rubrerythrin